MNIAKKIKGVREAQIKSHGREDWTQEACAKRARMSQSQWADLERGRYSPQFDTLQRVAKALQCSVAEMVQRLS